MRCRPTLPIVLLGALPALAALPGLWLGALQVTDALRHPPAGGIVGLGLVVGFWLLLGSLFVVCVAMLVTRIALDVRDLRNRALRGDLPQ
jgi:hypothetical protein